MDTQDYRNVIQERRKRIFSFRNLLLLVISLLIVFLFLMQIDIAGTLTVISNIKPIFLIVLFMLYCLSNYLKSVRFLLMLKENSLTSSDMFAIVSYQNFFNLILPARTGELTLIYYLKKIGGLTISEGLHSLILSRFMDLMTVALIFIISSYFYWGKSIPLPLLLFSLIMLSISLLFVFRLRAMLNFLNRSIEFSAKISGIRGSGLIRKMFDLLVKFRNSIPEYSRKRDYIFLLLITGIIWMNTYLIFYFNIKAMIDDFSFLRVLIGATGAVLTNTLPINSFGSFGTLEAGWTGGFMLVGMNLQDAIITGFGFHIIMLICAAIISSGCWLILIIKKTD